MFVQMKKFTVTEGNAHHLVEKFSQKGIIDEQPGIIDITVMVKKYVEEMKKLYCKFVGNRNRIGRTGRKAKHTLLDIKQVEENQSLNLF